jgi:hypothetical protein
VLRSDSDQVLSNGYRFNLLSTLVSGLKNWSRSESTRLRFSAGKIGTLGAGRIEDFDTLKQSSMRSHDSSMNDLVKHWSMKHRQKDLTHVLRRSVELAAVPVIHGNKNGNPKAAVR